MMCILFAPYEWGVDFDFYFFLCLLGVGFEERGRRRIRGEVEIHFHAVCVRGFLLPLPLHLPRILAFQLEIDLGFLLSRFDIRYAKT
jgi:hypothetical protein